MKWCCKKRRGLSTGEIDRELKAWMLQATRGRYQPSSWKTANDILITITSNKLGSYLGLIMS